MESQHIQGRNLWDVHMHEMYTCARNRFHTVAFGHHYRMTWLRWAGTTPRSLQTLGSSRADCFSVAFLWSVSPGHWCSSRTGYCFCADLSAWTATVVHSESFIDLSPQALQWLNT